MYLGGDAAGHVKVSTVGGVVTGFRGALGVVEAILNGWVQPRIAGPTAGAIPLQADPKGFTWFHSGRL